MKNAISGTIILLLLAFGTYTIFTNNGTGETADAAASSIYVSPDGSNVNEGTKERPVKSLQQALDLAEPGTAIYLRGGTYQGPFHTVNSGSKENPIVIQNYQDEKVVISGEQLSQEELQEDTALLTIDSTDYITVKGLSFEALTTDSDEIAVMGILVTGTSSYIDLSQNEVRRIANTADEGNAHGIAVYGTGSMQQITVDDNLVEELTLGFSEALVLNGNIDSFSVSGNTVRNNNNIGIDLIGFEGTAEEADEDFVRNGTVENNTVYNNSTYDNPAYNDYSSAGIYVDGGSSIRIAGNTVYQNDIGIEATSEHQDRYASDITVTENIVSENTYTGISIGGYDEDRGGTKHSVITNNTLYRNDTKDLYGGQLLLQHDVMDNTISGNVFTASDSRLFIGNEFVSNSGNSLSANTYTKEAGKDGYWMWKQQEYDRFEDYLKASGETDSVYEAAE